jgi:MFS family permease
MEHVQLGPVIAGSMSDNYGWRSFWWLCTGLAVFATVFQVLLMPETRWGDRQGPITRDVVGETRVESHNEKEVTCEENVQPSTSAADGNEIIIKLAGRPCLAQFSLSGKLDRASAKGIIPALIMPFRLFLYPIVLWSSFSFAWAASMLVIINVTQSQAFAGPPWNFSAEHIGFTNFGALVGVALSLVVAGPLSDWVSGFLTRRNNGIREPEMRLVALAPFIISCMLGGVLVAVGYQHQWSWEAIVIGGYGLLGFVLPAISAISLTYAVSLLPQGSQSLFGTGKLTNLPPPIDRRLQASRRRDPRQCHHDQESMGVRDDQVLQQLDRPCRVYPAHHVRHVSRSVYLLVGRATFLRGQEVQTLDEK